MHTLIQQPDLFTFVGYITLWYHRYILPANEKDSTTGTRCAQGNLHSICSEQKEHHNFVSCLQVFL